MEKREQTESRRVITGEGHGEIVEKKSRFIATLLPVRTEKEALGFIDSVRRKYYDARHNCFAFLLKEGPLERCSDDGEPAGTAGRPMLEVLRGAGLTDVAAVVTRYFGGTLLGTGPLARAYGRAVQEALEHCEIVTIRRGIRYRITADYGQSGRLQHLFAQQQIMTEETVYTDQVEFHIFVPGRDHERLTGRITELTGAGAGIEKLEETWRRYPG